MPIFNQVTEFASEYFKVWLDASVFSSQLKVYELYYPNYLWLYGMQVIICIYFRGFVFSSVPVRTDLEIRATKYEKNKNKNPIMIILFYIEIMII